MEPASPGAASRVRSFTIDSFSISALDAQRHSPSAPEIVENTLGRATWVFSDVLLNISSREKDEPRSLISKCNQLVLVLQENPQMVEELLMENIVARIHFMLPHQLSQVRCAAYRVLRHALGSPHSLQCLVLLKVLIFLIVSLSTPAPLLEKEEALKLARKFLAIPNGVHYLSVGLVRALVALVEEESEEQVHKGIPVPEAANALLLPDLTRLCIETICEMALLKPEVVFHAGGLRLMILLIVNGSLDVAAPCLMTLLALLDAPESRLFLRNGYDMNLLIAVYSMFEDDDSIKHTNTKRYYNRALKISFLLSILLKTWTGLVCFSHNNFEWLRNLINKLRKKNNKLRGVIMDLFLDVFRIKALPWLEDLSIGEMVQKVHSFVSPSHAPRLSADYAKIKPGSFEADVIAHYHGFLAKVLINCGLVPVLMNIIDENRDEPTTGKITYFLTRFFEIATRTLPKSFYNQQIFYTCDPALSLVSMHRVEQATKLLSRRINGRRRNEVKLYVKEIAMRARQDVDDNQFKTMISDTRLMSGKHTSNDWNWTNIGLLFQGPLRVPRRFAEVQEKYPKLLKSIMSYFRPFKYRFGELPLQSTSQHKNPKRMIFVGSQILESLLSFDAGAKYLGLNKLLPQLAEIFAQVSPFSGIRAERPVLSKKHLESTCSVGYLRFVGVLTSNPNGVQILAKWQFFQIIGDIICGSADDEGNNHLLLNLFNNMEFSLDGQLRVLLLKAMGVANWKVKVFVLESVVPRLLASEESVQLAITCLVNALYDTSNLVVKMAVERLNDYFIEKSNDARIDVLVKHKPSIAILETYGLQLLETMCRTPLGFHYLVECGYVDGAFAKAVADLNDLSFLHDVESTLTASLFAYGTIFSMDRPKPASLRHFFNYLLSTEEGFNYFNANRSCLDNMLGEINSILAKLEIIDMPEKPRSVFDESTIEESPRDLDYDTASHSSQASFGESPVKPRDFPVFSTLEEEEMYMLQVLKHHLWVVGEIAAAKYGMQILDPIYGTEIKGEHIVETLVLLFRRATSWEIRGLAFFQLGKVALTVEGVEILDDLQWISLDSREAPTPFVAAYPKLLQNEDVFGIEPANPYEAPLYLNFYGANEAPVEEPGFDVDDEYENVDDRVLSLFNHLTSVFPKSVPKAMAELTRLKSDDPAIFESSTLFLKTIRLVDKGQFNYRTRVFIFGLFQLGLILESVARRDRKLSSTKR